MRRRTLVLGGLCAGLSLPFVARWLVQSSVLFAWRQQHRAALDTFARMDDENSHGDHSGVALLADGPGLTLLGTTRRVRNFGWLLRLTLTGEL
jgi:hypothetical protein